KQRMQRRLDARRWTAGRQHAARHEPHHFDVAHHRDVAQRRQARQRQLREPVAPDGAQVGAAALHEQGFSELDRRVPTARLHQAWLPPDKLGEVHELVELVGARRRATGPAPVDVPTGNVRGHGPVRCALPGDARAPSKARPLAVPDLSRRRSMYTVASGTVAAGALVAGTPQGGMATKAPRARHRRIDALRRATRLLLIAALVGCGERAPTDVTPDAALL